MSDIPKGFWKIEAFTNGYQIVVVGIPPDSEELGISDNDPRNHNCDEMGCGSVGTHVVARIPIMYPMPELRWADVNFRNSTPAAPDRNNFEPGDRVRIVGGVWMNNCGTVVLVAKDAVKVRADTRLLNVIVRPYDLERIE